MKTVLPNAGFVSEGGTDTRKPMLEVGSPPADVLSHLADALKRQWKRYRKRLRRCQEHFSEAAVHASRVETRRLLATVELLGAFLPEKKIARARRALKRHLDTFDELRDTQVQLLYVGKMLRAFPRAKAFRELLLKREKRLMRSTRREIRRIKTKRLGRLLDTFRDEICARRKDWSAERAYTAVVRAVDRAFRRVLRLRQRIDPKDTTTIHRTRVAFKKFRYMLEWLDGIVPGISAEQLRAMHGHQTLMGDVQDMEVLLATLDKFSEREENEAQWLGHFREELLRRRQWVIRRYLGVAGSVNEFWPLDSLAAGLKRPKTKNNSP